MYSKPKKKWWKDKRIVLWREPNYKMEITGTMFNQEYVENLKYKFIKLTNFSENHNGYQFKDGLNIDIIDFNPNGLCNLGGIYFINEIYILKWLKYNKKTMIWYRKVTIPDDAKVYIEDRKFKTDMIILGSKKPIKDHILCIIDNDRKYTKLYTSPQLNYRYRRNSDA